MLIRTFGEMMCRKAGAYMMLCYVLAISWMVFCLFDSAWKWLVAALALLLSVFVLWSDDVRLKDVSSTLLFDIVLLMSMIPAVLYPRLFPSAVFLSVAAFIDAVLWFVDRKESEKSWKDVIENELCLPVELELPLAAGLVLPGVWSGGLFSVAALAVAILLVADYFRRTKRAGR